MRWFRSRLLPALAALVALFAGAFAQQPPSTPPAKEAAPPAQADPAAKKVLDAAIDKVDPRKMGSLKMTLWQQLDVQGLTFEAVGSYLLGPARQLRLDLKLQVGGAQGSLKIISDGKTLWDITRIGDQPPTVARVDLTRVLGLLESPNLLETREQFFQSQSFSGVQPLLAALRKQIVFTQIKDGRWESKDVYVLTGSWTDAPRDVKQWPEAMPRRCRLYLDRESYWPYRLEWWGPAAGHKDDVLLMQIEFRNPEHPGKLDPRLFVFDPSKLGVEVVDRTAAYEQLAKQAARQPGAAGPKR